jgi:hypothetical protein
MDSVLIHEVLYVNEGLTTKSSLAGEFAHVLSPLALDPIMTLREQNGTLPLQSAYSAVIQLGFNFLHEIRRLKKQLIPCLGSP